MVNFVRSSDRLEIWVIGVSEHFESLVNENVVHQKIREPVNRDSQSYPKKGIIALQHAKKQSGNTRQSKNEEEKIIVLKEAVGFLFVVIPMQIPQKTVHDVFMREPGHPFHAEKGKQHDSCIYKYVFHVRHIQFAKIVSIEKGC